MSFTVADAAKLVTNELIKGIALNVFTKDKFLPALNYQSENRPQVVWNKENSLGTDPAFILAGGAVSESAPTFTQDSIYVERLIGDVSLPSSVEALYAADQDPLMLVLAEKLKSFQRVIGNAIINGNGAHPNIRGLATYVANASASQMLNPQGANGDALSLTTLDQLMYSYCKVENDRVFIMNGQLLTKFSALMRAAGGNREMDWNGALVQQYNGIPVIQSDWIPSTETVGSYNTGSSVYCVSLDETMGATLVVNEFAPQTADGVVSEGMFKIQKVGLDPSNDLTKYRIYCNLGLLIKSPLAVARASGLITT